MVMVDHGLMKGVILIPCSKTIDAARVAKLFLHHVFKQFSLHDSLISDRGPQFASTFARELAQLLHYDPSDAISHRICKKLPKWSHTLGALADNEFGPRSSSQWWSILIQVGLVHSGTYITMTWKRSAGPVSCVIKSRSISSTMQCADRLTNAFCAQRGIPLTSSMWSCKWRSQWYCCYFLLVVSECQLTYLREVTFHPMWSDLLPLAQGAHVPDLVQWQKEHLHQRKGSPLSSCHYCGAWWRSMAPRLLRSKKLWQV